MAARGRKSSAANAVATLVKPVTTLVRPDAPYDLTDEESDEWRAVVERMPGGWFERETFALLSQFCRHVVAARRIAQLADAALKAEEFDVEGYDRLRKMAERESRTMSSLATRMRITQQATYDKSKKKRSSYAKKPWEP